MSKKIIPFAIIIGIAACVGILSISNTIFVKKNYALKYASSNRQILYSNDFESKNISDFGVRGTTNLSVSTNSATGNFSLQASNRTNDWNGPMIKLSDKGEPNVEYLIHVKVMNLNGTNVNIGYRYNDSTNTTKYSSLGTFTGEGWQSVENLKFMYTEEMSEVYIYFQGGTDDIYIDDLVIEIATFEKDIPSLKNVFSNNFKMGVAVSQKEISSNVVKGLIQKHFDTMTMTNELKPEYILDKEASLATGTYDNPQVSLDSAREILDFARDNNKAIRGHTLIWYMQTPEWFFREEYDENKAWVSKELMIKRMENFIKNVFQALKDEYPTVEIFAWDVVNEAWLENGNDRSHCRTSIADKVNGLSCSIWSTIFGDNSFIEYAYTFARKYAPKNTKLIYNDFTTFIPAKRDSIYNMLMNLKSKNLIDGIGMQSHLVSEITTDEEYKEHLNLYEQAMQLYISTGLDVQITELDMGKFDIQKHASNYNDIMNIIAKYSENISSVTFWGLTDDRSWKSEDSPLLFYANYKAKPEFYAIIDEKLKIDYQAKKK